MNESSGKNRENSIDGFVVIDKPKGPTSHQVDYWVRQILDVDKVGHIGTLDPNASGVLVMAIGKAVKLIDVAHEYPKEYVTVMRLYGDFGRDQLLAAFDQFKGDIYQLPPMKSAVARALRIRRIYELEIKEVLDRLVMYRVKCESGTYIRTLCIDIGYVLGPGAQMAELRRTATGPFDESMIHTLQELSDAVYMSKNGDPSRLQGLIIPMLELFRNDPKIVVKRTTLSNIAHGSDLFPGGIRAITGKPMKGDRVAVVTEENELVGTGKMLVNYDSIMDLKVVDFDRILLENPDQKPTPVMPASREPPHRPASFNRNGNGGNQKSGFHMRNERRPHGGGSYGRKRAR
ncbi:MAG: RNA-guided pseudouridylation complex pseudouridine synthase subunit Cbf5 [Thermoplasmataceae archaeon]